MINFSVSHADHLVIMQIVDRAMRFYEQVGVPRQKMTVVMDVTATHANGCPLPGFHPRDLTGERR